MTRQWYRECHPFKLNAAGWEKPADISWPHPYRVRVCGIEPEIIPEDYAVRMQYPHHLLSDIFLDIFVQNGREDSELQHQVKTACGIWQGLTITS